MIAILLFEGFSNLCLANAVEPLRAANTLSTRELYRWRFVGLGGSVVHSSSRLPVQVEPLDRFGGGDFLFVMPSYGHREHDTPACRRALVAAADRFTHLAALDTGSWLLAAAGLLDGRRATSHWDILASLGETFPEVTVVPGRYVIDGDRLSCGGATTTLDMMLDLIARHHGAELSLEVGSMFMVGEREARGGGEPSRDGRRLAPPDLARAGSAIMRRHVEHPLPIAQVAAQLGVSPRRLGAAFASAMGRTPADVYRSVRLAEARRWVEQSAISIAEVAERCGYRDASAMTRAFRETFAATPRALRKAALTSAPTA